MIPRGSKAAIRSGRGGVGEYLAIDPRLTQPAGDQLSHLAAEIQDQDAVVKRGVLHGDMQHSRPMPGKRRR